MKGSKIYLMMLSLAALYMPLFLKSRGASKRFDTVSCGSLLIIDKEKTDTVEIYFTLFRSQQKNDHDITSGVLSLENSNWERRIFETDDGIIQATYNGKTHLLSVIAFVKNKTGNYRQTLKTEKRLRSAIQLSSKKIDHAVVETFPTQHYIYIPRVKNN